MRRKSLNAEFKVDLLKLKTVKIPRIDENIKIGFINKEILPLLARKHGVVISIRTLLPPWL